MAYTHIKLWGRDSNTGVIIEVNETETERREAIAADINERTDASAREAKGFPRYVKPTGTTVSENLKFTGRRLAAQVHAALLDSLPPDVYAELREQFQTVGGRI